jgi:hypothetical protein
MGGTTGQPASWPREVKAMFFYTVWIYGPAIFAVHHLPVMGC